MSFGYFIWSPTLISEDPVDTHTPPGWFIFVNLIRIILALYVVYKYTMITRKTEEETKKRIQWFSVGVIIVIVGLVFNSAGGIFKLIEFEILALILIDIGAIVIVKGFFI